MLIIKVGISDGASLTSGSWMISESPAQWNRVLAVQMAKGRKQPKTKGLNRLTKAKIFNNPANGKSHAGAIQLPAAGLPLPTADSF